ncbi:hypothetical protein SLA2020_146550 [Shorea laevis]
MLSSLLTKIIGDYVGSVSWLAKRCLDCGDKGRFDAYVQNQGHLFWLHHIFIEFDKLNKLNMKLEIGFSSLAI